MCIECRTDIFGIKNKMIVEDTHKNTVCIWETNKGE